MTSIRVSGFGLRVSAFGFGFRISGFGVRVSNSGLRFRVSGFGFRDSSFGLRVSAFGFGFRGNLVVAELHLDADSGFGIRVQGLEWFSHPLATKRMNQWQTLLKLVLNCQLLPLFIFWWPANVKPDLPRCSGAPF
jgi:hypothetical protein